MSRNSTKEEKTSREEKNSKNTNEEVQRAIDGLNEIPDDELQEFLDDEDFIEGLDVVDAWEGDDDTCEEPQQGNRDREYRKNSRDRNHGGRRGGREARGRGGKRKREDRKRDDVRRDPSKSSKDIERDKLRTRRDNENKILAEKEKAIKHLLDSDTIVPPGTEVEAIETELHRRDHPRGTRERSRPQGASPPRRRSPRLREKNSFLPSPERRRRTSWDRRSSRSRRASHERHSRRRIEERELRISNRRSRSRIRSRSRRRWSRSPRRGSSRRRSPTKTPERRRKRSPFLHEIARQLNQQDALLSGKINQGFVQQQASSIMQPINIQNQQLPQQQQQHHYGHAETIVPYVMPFEPQPTQMNFEQIPIHQHVEYTGAPLLFNPPNPMIPDQPIFQPGMINQIPQPVPAPIGNDSIFIANNQIGMPKTSPNAGTTARGFSEVYNGNKTTTNRRNRSERIKTPEPPVISDKKHVEKTSLSSLLEASVFAKVNYKPEILRHCDQALRELPDEDPRLRMKGRFFFDPKVDEPEGQKEPEFLSNSILLQQRKTLNIWSQDDKKTEQTTKLQIETHQKYCQTELDYDERSTQTFIETVDFCVQVCPGDLNQSPIPREEKRPIMDRLDWNLRDKRDYRKGDNNDDDDDLRWSLSSSQKRKWSRTISPELDDIISSDSRSRNDEGLIDRDDKRDSRDRYRENSTPRSRGYMESPYGSRRESYRERSERFSPDFRREINRRDRYEEDRSRHSRDISPDIDEDDPGILDDDSVFSRESNWRERSSGRKFSKPRGSGRGQFSGGRSFRGRGSNNYRGGKY